MIFPPPFQSLFSHTTLELSIAISTYRDLCCERILGDQSVVITKDFFLCFEEADVCVLIISGSSGNSVFEVRPRRASGLAVCTGLESLWSSSVNSPCRCYGTE